MNSFKPYSMQGHDIPRENNWATAADGKTRISLRTCATCGAEIQTTAEENKAFVYRVKQPWSTKYITLSTATRCGAVQGKQGVKRPETLAMEREHQHVVRQSWATEANAIADSYEPEPVHNKPVSYPQERHLTNSEAMVAESFTIIKILVETIHMEDLIDRIPDNVKGIVRRYFESKSYGEWYRKLQEA